MVESTRKILLNKRQAEDVETPTTPAYSERPTVPPASEDTAVSDVTHSVPTQPVDDFLVTIYGTSTGRRFRIGDADVTIGREPDNDVVLREHGVSRHHAVVGRAVSGFVITDLNSTNGTLLNDAVLRGRAELAHGDRIKVGQTILKFFSGDEAESAFQEQIYQQTIFDQLTGLANRRHFDDTLDRVHSRVRRYNRPVTVLLFDIDHFKNVNDSYGHPTGDEVLRNVAKAAQACLRHGDFVARYGGEEFAVILEELALPDAAMLAERLRSAVAATVTMFEHVPISITLSIGCAMVEATDEDFRAAVERADDKLYEAKNSGRDRVCY